MRVLVLLGWAVVFAAQSDVKADFNLGLEYVKSGRYEEAIKLLEPARSQPELAIQARFLIGGARFELKQFPQAAAELEPLRTNPEYAERVLYFVEESYRQSGRLEDAERAFSDLLRQYPNSALVHKLLGTAHDAQGDTRGAIAEFQKAAEIDPALPGVKFDIALQYLKEHDNEKARKWLHEELAVNPCHAASLYYLGETDRLAGRPDAAVDSYRKAIRCAPSNGEAYRALGVALQSQGKDEEALRALRRAVELMPDKSEAHFQLARALAKAGLKEESQRELEKARALADAK